LTSALRCLPEQSEDPDEVTTTTLTGRLLAGSTPVATAMGSAGRTFGGGLCSHSLLLLFNLHGGR
jgi:hypothetical protein